MEDIDKTYRSRDFLMMSLMAVIEKTHGYTTGWSKRHSDGELCFGGGWVLAWIKTPRNREIRFHLKESEAELLPVYLERAVAPEWNCVEETEDGLIEIIQHFLPKQMEVGGVDDRLPGETHHHWCERMRWMHQAGK